MRALICLCLAAFVLLLPVRRAAAKDETVAPWLQNMPATAQGGDGQVRNPRGGIIAPGVPTINHHAPATYPKCYRVLTLEHRGADEMQLLFAPPWNITPQMQWGVTPFLPAGARVSRAGEDKLLVTADIEADINQIERLVRLLDHPIERTILEIMLVETTRYFPLPDANPDVTINCKGIYTFQTMPMHEGLMPFLREPDTIIHRTFLDISTGQQGVLQLEAFPLPIKGVLFDSVMIFPDNTLTLSLKALSKTKNERKQNIYINTYKNQSALLLNALLPVLEQREDPAGKAHYYYLFAGVTICRDDRARLADAMRPPRVFYDGRLNPLIILLHDTWVEQILPAGAWLEDGITAPADWLDRNNRATQDPASFAVSPSMNALVTAGTPQQRSALRECIDALDVQQHPLMVECQFIRVDNTVLAQELGAIRTHGGDLRLSGGLAEVPGKLATLLRNDRAKMVMLPRVTVQPFGSASVELDGWGLRIDTASTRKGGIIAVQGTVMFPASLSAQTKYRLGHESGNLLILPEGKPLYAGMISPEDPKADYQVLLVVQATPNPPLPLPPLF